MTLFLRILCCIIILNIIGCTTQQKILVKAAPPQKQCLAVCAERFESCKSLCVNNCAICSSNATYSAAKNDAKYIHEKIVEGGTITRGLKSYRDPLQCRKVTCNCYADLSICEQNCTGIIHKQLRPVPYCA